MGFVDRGGGREAKGSSLRRSKKNPGAPSTRNKAMQKNYTVPLTRALPVPPPSCRALLNAMAAERARGSASVPSPAENTAAAGAGASVTGLANGFQYVDAAVALLSRKLEEDQQGIFRRAVEEGKVAAMLCWCNEIERQPQLLETCKHCDKWINTLNRCEETSAAAEAIPLTAKKTKKVRFSVEGEPKADSHRTSPSSTPQPSQGGRGNAAAASSSPVPVRVSGGGGGGSSNQGACALYCLLGVHVNNIDRMNRKVHGQWIEDIAAQAKNSEVLGILSGLNLSRETGTHFAQEWLLRQCWRVAAKEKLPLVLHVYAGDEQLARTSDRVAELLQELLAGRATEETEDDVLGGVTGTPTAVVLYNGLKALASSAALQALFRRHRPRDIKSSLDAAEEEEEKGGRADGEEGTAAKKAAESDDSGVPTYLIVTAEGLTQSTSATTAEPTSAKAKEGRNEPTGDASAAAQAASSAGDMTAVLKALTSSSSSSSSPSSMPVEAELPVVSLSQLLIGSGAPWGTPQNIPDEYVRTQPNEPANYPYVVDAVYSAITGHSENKDSAGHATPPSRDAFAAQTLRNFMSVFFDSFIAANAAAASSSSAPQQAHQQRDEAEKGEREGDDGDEAAEDSSEDSANEAEKKGGRDASDAESGSDTEERGAKKGQKRGGSKRGSEGNAGKAPSAAGQRKSAASSATGDMTEADVAAAAALAPLGLVPAPGVVGSRAVYRCMKCRTPLFRESALVQHPPAADSTRGQQGGRGGSTLSPPPAGASAAVKQQQCRRKGKKGRKGKRGDSDCSDDDVPPATGAATSSSFSSTDCGGTLVWRVVDPAARDDTNSAAMRHVDPDLLMTSLALLQVEGEVGGQNTDATHHRSSKQQQQQQKESRSSSESEDDSDDDEDEDESRSEDENAEEAQTKAVHVVRLQGTNVTCATCGTKLGNIKNDAPCHCGCLVPGLTIRVVPARVELDRGVRAVAADDAVAAAGDKEEGKQKKSKAATSSSAPAHASASAIAVVGGEDGGDDLQALLEQAAREREQLEREREAAENDPDASAAAAASRRKKEPKKNVKANNRSNFTHFRNKDFAPRQARLEKNPQHHASAYAKQSPSSSDDDGGEGEEVTGNNSDDSN